MISVVAGFSVKEGKEAECLEYVRKIVEETRKEKGCIMYELCQSAKSANSFAFIEKWESQDALNAHMETAHFKEYVPKIDSVTVDGVAINVYTVLV